MNDPYRILAPSLISFSGGRTSAFMLRQILDAHNGTLPDGVHVTFANTGKERNETLDFVRDVERRWSVPIIWLEYRRGAAINDQPEPDTFAIVDYETAARSGEPFAALIEKRKFLPNPVTRFCTSELKIRVMKKYMLSLGYEEWDVAIGFRADEPTRVHRAKLSCSRERWTNITPMASAGHYLDDVIGFWASQPFDLQLKQHEGNCDLCFLKGAAKIERIMLDSPCLGGWWADQERKVSATFREDRPSYSSLMNIIKEQGRFGFDDHEYTVCGCTD